MRIEGKNAIVTGGASGLGKATVEKLCEKGCRVILADLKNSDGELICNEISSKGYFAKFFPTDVSSEENILELLKFAITELGEIHVLVNCAGKAEKQLTLKKSGETHSLKKFKEVFEVNVMGTFNMTKHFAFQMSKQKEFENGIKGVIVNVSSVTAEEGPSGLVAYASSKGAVNGMTLPMSRDLSFFGIRLITVAPGLFRTKMTENQFQEVKEESNKVNNFTRAGNPNEFAHFATAIIENDYLHGVILRIDMGDKVPKK